MDGWFEIPPTARANPAGILFAEDFDAAPAASPPPRPRPSFTAAELEAARAAAYAEGREIGLAEATAQHDAALADAARAVGGKVAALRHDATLAAERAAAAVAQALLDALAALFPAACASLGPREAASVLRALVPCLGGEPSLHLSANPSLLPALGAELARLDPALAARTTATPSEIMAPGDVSLAWAHGRACRDSAALWRALAQALAPAGLTLPLMPESTDA